MDMVTAMPAAGRAVMPQQPNEPAVRQDKADPGQCAPRSAGLPAGDRYSAPRPSNRRLVPADHDSPVFPAIVRKGALDSVGCWFQSMQETPRLPEPLSLRRLACSPPISLARVQRETGRPYVERQLNHLLTRPRSRPRPGSCCYVAQRACASMAAARAMGLHSHQKAGAKMAAREPSEVTNLDIHGDAVLPGSRPRDALAV
jgi:hypothetical protein